MANEARQESEAERPTVSRELPFGKYSLQRVLGKGGMGVVYEATDRILNRRVALKMVLPHPGASDEERKSEEERFLREAQLAANLPKHPHVVSVYEAGTIEGRQYLAMEFVAGRPFSDWRRAETPPLRRQVEILRDVARAVQHAHEHGVIHRDLKPGNILVDSRSQPHVTDFGLAKTVGRPVTDSLTVSGMIVGTPSFMSPEQAKGSKALDGRADVYSLGVMLYEVLAGRLPYEAETAMDLLVKVLTEPITPPSRRTSLGVDPALETVCLRALERNPEQRHPSAGAFADDLDRWLRGEEVRVAPAARRRPVGAWVAAALVLAAVGFLGLRRGSKPRPAAPPPRASEAGLRATLEGHGDNVNAVAFSAHGILASGSRDGTVKLWDPATGKERMTLAGHGGRVEGLSFSADAIASVTEESLEDGTQRGEVKVWDYPAGRVRWEVDGHPASINAVAFSPDGRWVATGDQAALFSLWDAATGRPAGVLRGHAAAIRAIAFLPDGKTAASAGWDSTVKLWDLEKPVEPRTLSGHEQGIWGMAVSPDGRLIATAGSDRTARVWEVAEGKERHILRGHEKTVQCVAFSPNGKTLASGSRDRTIKLWDVSTGAERTALRGHTDTVWTLAFSPDGKTLASGGMDRAVRLWNIPE